MAHKEWCTSLCWQVILKNNIGMTLVEIILKLEVPNLFSWQRCKRRKITMQFWSLKIWTSAEPPILHYYKEVDFTYSIQFDVYLVCIWISSSRSHRLPLLVIHRERLYAVKYNVYMEIFNLMIIYLYNSLVSLEVRYK